MRKLAFPLLTAMLLCIGPAHAGPASSDEMTLRERVRQRLAERGTTSRLAPGTHTFHLQHDGLTRKYVVYVPEALRQSGPAPVVLAFHGGGGSAEFMADDERYGLSSAAERHAFIAVFPNGYSKLPGGKLATWNAGGCCGDARDRDVDDVGFVRALIARLGTQANIDHQRVFATGMSNGGMFVHRLACELGDVVKAVASVAGTDGTLECRPSRTIPVLQIHARNDTHVLFDGGAGTDAFRDPGKVMEFRSVPETVSRWVTRNGCTPTPTRTLDRPGAFCDTYSHCTGGASVQLCVTEQGGHSWPGAEKVRRGKEPASTALSANEVMLDFFETSSRSRKPADR